MVDYTKGEFMSKEIMFQRVLENRCPVSGKPIKEEETEVVDYNEAKLVVIKRYIKFER